MNLVERFIEFQRWPTSRKTVLLMAVAFAAHALVTPIAIYYAAQSGVVDAKRLTWVASAAIPVTVVCWLAGWLAARAGKEGRWTAYLVIAGYGSWVLTMDAMFGVWNTPMLAWGTADVILVALWYDERIGVTALVAFLIVFSLIVGLTLNGLLPYAPLILDRSLDSQSHGGWVLTLLAAFIGFFLYDFLLSVLVVAARRLQDQRLRLAYQQLDRSAQLIRRYIPSQLADKIISGEHSEVFNPDRAKLTVFFSDIEGFTEASDHLDPEELAALLNEYLSEMVGIAEKHGATINQIIGDGIMAFFGAPHATTDKDHALRAVCMAVEMQRRLMELRDVWSSRGIQKPFRARVGINTGHASVGDYGSPGRKLYSAIGLQTNLAARIQAHCEPGRILISHSTWALVNDEIGCIDRGELQLKGVQHPVRVYEVVEGGEQRRAVA